MAKSLVQKQFGEHAAAYATSEVHAKGASLARLVELVNPEETWRVLDIATAAGHTAFALAPHVREVVASDITPEMLPVARKLAGEKEIHNVLFELADAEQLPFAAGEFDLVTCRIAPHHFARIERFVGESRRVLRPGGLLAVVDNVVPGSDADTAEGAALRAAGDYVNRFEQLRDPSHVRCLSVEEWLTVLTEAGFTLIVAETAPKRMAFDPWVKRLGAAPDVQEEVRTLLEQAPTAAAEFFQIEADGADLAFHLVEGIFVACNGDRV